MHLDVLCEDPRWSQLGLADLSAAALCATLDHLSLTSGNVAVSVLGCDDARIAVLNADFRGKPRATNVLSWPATELSAAVPGAPPAAPQADPDGTIELGDIALAFETCTLEAGEQGKTARAHLTHLLVHGTLHLLGYDHETDADAALMERLEREVLGKMGVDDPYRN